MTTISSRKAKGRRLQNFVRDTLIKTFKLNPVDVRCAIMGEGGVDIKLSPRAAKKFPWAVECKNQEAYANVYKDFDQAQFNADKERLSPLLLIKRNRREPLVVMTFEKFLEVLYGKRKNTTGSRAGEGVS